MSLTYRAVIATLGQLTPEERGRVAERLRAMASLVPAHAGGRPSAQAPEDEVLEAICAAAARMSGERVVPAALRRVGQFSALRAKTPALAAYAVAHAPDRARRRALLSLGFDLLYRDLAAMGVAVSARALMSHAHRLPSVIDAAFPGYARAGLLRMVLEVREGAGKESDAQEEV